MIIMYAPWGSTWKTKAVTAKKQLQDFIQPVTKYAAINCSTCPLNGSCHKSNRAIEINNRLTKLKQQANENLLSEEGIKKRKQRCHDVEPVFANIKDNP